MCQSPTQPIRWLIIAIRATKASSIAAMLIASFMPSDAPAAAASMMFLLSFSMCTVTEPAVSGVPVSGIRILAISSVAGAAMIDAARKCLA